MQQITDIAAPPGLRYIVEFLTQEQERMLLAALAPLDWDGRGVIRRRQIVKRRELDFVRNYSRNNRKLGESTPLPDFLTPIRERVAQEVGIAPQELGQIITALYRSGAGIDWHTDAITAFGETICGVSLGAACKMQFRKAKDEPIFTMVLEPRSLLIMQGPARWEYQHHIPAVKHTRYSVTLRTLKGVSR